MKKAGILLHISSLPGDYGIGTMGRSAYAFIDFLVASGQKYWQILPLGPTVAGNSPYLTSSIYAGNPLLIDFDALFDDGLIGKNDYEFLNKTKDRSKVDYELLNENKLRILKLAYKNKSKVTKEYNEFLEKNSEWVNDYALFCCLKTYHHDLPWIEWEETFRLRGPKLEGFIKKNYFEIDEYRFIQFLFYKQYYRMKRYANQNGIEIIGDMPIYVPYDSADCWAKPQNFLLDYNLKPTRVAGVPPDAFSNTGQLWGNPVYDWDYMKEDDFSWWMNRIKFSLETYDLVRIDHFRGFSAYYSLSKDAKNAVNGVWTKAPGLELFSLVNKNLDGNKIIAENLGYLDFDVYNLLQFTGYPGMRIIQFELPDNFHSINNIDPNTIIYTGTHDNNTIMGWYRKLKMKDRGIINKQLNIPRSHRQKHWKFIEFVYNTDAKIAIVPFQDLYGLSDKARMNIPGTIVNNWEYRMLSSDINPELKEKLLKTVKMGQRYH